MITILIHGETGNINKYNVTSADKKYSVISKVFETIFSIPQRTTFLIVGQ